MIKLTLLLGNTVYLNINCIEALVKQEDITRIYTIGTNTSCFLVKEPIEEILKKLGWESYNEEDTIE